jgi:transcriptional regulator with XRE-family HTH domain
MPPVPRLKEYRLRARLMQEAVAERAGVSRDAVTKIEQGRSALLDTVRKLARALGTTTAVLLGDDKNGAGWGEGLTTAEQPPTVVPEAPVPLALAFSPDSPAVRERDDGAPTPRQQAGRTCLRRSGEKPLRADGPGGAFLRSCSTDLRVGTRLRTCGLVLLDGGQDGVHRL